MNRIAILIVVGVLTPALFVSGQSTSVIPSKIAALLDSTYPGWHLVNNLWVIDEPVLQHLHLDTAKCRPNFVWGDFNGDGKTDYVAYIERRLGSNPREQFLVAFLTERKGFTQYQLDQTSGDGYLGDYIWLVQKESKSYNFETDEEFVLEQDAIEIITIEKGSALIYYDQGEWKWITTSD